jgi:1-acyl-sn-glycerol-3-phosphate acyltransferase
MGNFFAGIYTYFQHHKGLLWSIFILFVVLFGFSFSRLHYNENISDFLPSTADDSSINFVYQRINGTNKILVYFEGKDTLRDNKEEIEEAIDLFVEKLKSGNTNRSFTSIMSSMDDKDMMDLSDYLLTNAPYFLSAADYRHIDSLRSEPAIRKQLENDKQLLMLPTGGIWIQNMMSDPTHLFSPLLEQLRLYKVSDRYVVDNNHIFTSNGKKGMVVLTSPYPSSETKQNAKLLSLIQKTIAEVVQECPQVTAHPFGAPVIAVTNARQIQYDSYLSVILSLILIFSLLIYEVRSARNLMLMAVSILFGYLFALGLIAIVHQSISIIVLGMSAVFIGIAINYSLHYILHLHHEPDVRQALKEIASPLTIGNITTVGAFLSLMFIHSSAMCDLGAFASLLLLGSILFVLIFLPHWVKVPSNRSASHGTWFQKLYHFSVGSKWYVVTPLIVLTLVFMYFSQYTSFDSNMQNINYMTSQQKADMQEMSESAEQEGKDVVYLIHRGKNDDEALQQYERQLPLLKQLQQDKTVSSVKGIGTLYPSVEEQKARLERWNAYWQTHREEYMQLLNRVSAEEGFKSGFTDTILSLLNTKFQQQPASFFSPIAKMAVDNYLIRDKKGTQIITLLYCDHNNGSVARLKNILKKQCPQALVFDSRNILQKMVDYLSNDFNYVLYVSGFIVFVFLVLSFGRIELTLLSFLPLVISWFWILGIMQLCSIQFNIVNIILATFIFGEGDDYAIFITEGLMYEYAHGKKMLASYKHSVILSAIIMFIGIGSLIFARHPAMRSLAEVTIVGMFSVVLMACIVPPLFFNWLTKKHGLYRKDPITLKRLSYTLYAFIAFLISTTCVTFIGHLLFAFRKKTEKKELFFHRILTNFARFVIPRIPGVKFTYRNLSGETFEKPAVIICNHQSHIDLMCVMMLTPKMIVLTNDWAWNSIFYGRLIKYADFYPVSDGIEKNLPQLREKVRQGYSIMVFPEGTRSADCSILRFHRGAFYLAQQLGLDILPVLIHGNGHVLPKEDFMLREGAIQTEIYPRITLQDTRFPSDYSARSREVRHYYRQIYNDLCLRTETTSYFEYRTLHNYLYKGPFIERAIRNSLKQNRDFADKIDSYQEKGRVLIKNCGRGEAALLFAYVHRDISVTAYEPDTEMFDIASHCCDIPKNLVFVSELPDETFDRTIAL